MDEALLKSGQFPNVAIMAGTDPKEVMREYGQTDTKHMDNGVSVHMCPNNTGAHSNVSKNLSDTREQLEADLNNLCLDCLGLGWNAANDLKKAIHKLLDRQDAITRRECADERENLLTEAIATCTKKISKLEAERDALKEQINRFNASKSEEIAENDTSKGVLNTFDVQNDTRELLEADVRSEYYGGIADEAEEIIGWLDRQAAITRRECADERENLLTEAIATCTKKISTLEAERDELREKLRIEREAVEACEGCDKVDELIAELDACKLRERAAEDYDFRAAAERWEQAYEGKCGEVVRLTEERDQLDRDLTAEHALVVQFEHDNEEIKADLKTANDTINTLRASVAGLKETVEKLGAK